MKLDLITNKAEKQAGINPNDEYYTPSYAIIPLLKYVRPNSKIWCPFDTEESNFVKIFRSNGHKVLYTHIKNGEDFFNLACPLDIDYIISNPPYSLITEVFERLFKIDKPFAMLVSARGIFESQRRFTMFKNNDFEILYFNKRIKYFKNYNDQKPMSNPPFSSVYICKNILPKQIIFETLENNNK